ncbi:MAG: peptidase C14, partial [Chitinophagaceae bacterium]
MNMKRALLFFLSCLVAFGSFAQPTQPILQLETGMHLGMINRISSDREGRYLLTCSDDKTARLWDAASGRLLRTLRIPMAAGNEGKIYACALSPDGRYAAIGGWTAYAWDSKCCIYILDAQTGAFIKKLKNLESSVLDLEFSPNGEWLAAGLAGSAGVQVFQTRSWTSYTAMKGYGGDVYGLSFSGNDVLASTCEDGHVRIYKDFTLQQDIANIGEEQRAICFSPDGKTLAVAGQEVPTVTLLDARTGRIIERHTNKDVEQDRKFTALAFSQDGSQLWAGGSPTAWNATTERWQRFLRSWSNGGRGSFTDHPIFSNIV